MLDPFTGSGSTGCAAVLEGFDFIGCELTPEYIPIIERRIAYWQAQHDAEQHAARVAPIQIGIFQDAA